MENFPEETLHSPQGLADFLLQNGVDSSTVEILKDEGITGSTVIDVTEEDLRELHVKMGPRKKILQIIKSHTTQVRAETGIAVTSLVEDQVILPTVEEHSQEIGRNAEEIHKKPTNSCIEIRKWIESHSQGQRLINVLDNEVYTPEDRCLLVRIVMGEVIKICNSEYPSSEMKDEITKKIVNEFPCLKSVREDATGHEHFYDKRSGTGFLEYRLKTVRKGLSPSKKRRKVKTSKKASEVRQFDMVLSTEDFKEKVVWMKLTNSTDFHKQAIIDALEETRANRQNEIISDKPTITEILDKYPRLADYNGEMIEREFKWLHPNAENFLMKFSFYAARILNYVKCKKPQLLPLVADFDENLKALALLPELLPVANYTKRKRKQVKSVQQKTYIKTLPHSHLLKFVNANEDFNSAIEANSTQPYMVCAQLGSKKAGQYFLNLERKYVEVADNPVTAFDLLFKSHFVFNVHYADELQNFYDFVCGCIYKIGKPNPSSDALNSCLLNVPVDLSS